jgi:hypothetical protein
VQSFLRLPDELRVKAPLEKLQRFMISASLRPALVEW